jgi:hypothetical protein
VVGKCVGDGCRHYRGKRERSWKGKSVRERESMANKVEKRIRPFPPFGAYPIRDKILRVLGRVEEEETE